jgi:pimeloyl-ACP methyl ester carboxylesterase
MIMTESGLPASKQFVQTSFGRIAYLETGSAPKPPVLLIHGIPTSGYLWRHVLRLLQNDFHCYAPDLMGLGDTDVDPERTKFHMEAQAEMLEELMATLGHESFAMVCHDQGGAAAQILAAFRPQLIRCWVITNCVCYDNWPVPAIARLQALMRVPVLPELFVRARLFHLLETKTPLSAFRRGVYDPAKLSDEAIEEYLRPLLAGQRERERFVKFLLAGSPAYTRRAVEGMRRFDKPTLVVWAADDHYLSPSWGRKLQEEIPGARRFELVPFCGHFWQEERPAEFAAQIGEFLAAHAGEPRREPRGDR